MRDDLPRDHIHAGRFDANLSVRNMLPAAAPAHSPDGRIERLVAADPKIDARRADECIDFGQDEIGANRRRRDGKRLRQIFALLAIEDREPL